MCGPRLQVPASVGAGVEGVGVVGAQGPGVVDDELVEEGVACSGSSLSLTATAWL